MRNFPDDEVNCNNVCRELGRGKFSVVYKAAVKGTRQTVRAAAAASAAASLGNSASTSTIMTAGFQPPQVAIKRIAIFDIMDSKSRKKTLREVRALLLVHPRTVLHGVVFIITATITTPVTIAFAGRAAAQLPASPTHHPLLGQLHRQQRALHRFRVSRQRHDDGGGDVCATTRRDDSVVVCVL